ncbi:MULTISPECIES: cell division inhibitor SulA [Marinobacter]|uniref:cell division inhibitor SulA n=1 Tax=Marinobacter TaxID=2742 RepID=UPI000718DB4D|nr:MULTISPECIES: SulA-like leucine-rich domain-containing protein [unclassified Marinobacter]AMQ90565.1 LexA family transcriptional regulator [Marinobacter sp. LQ44]MDX5327466.1 LexA family transcriptional regulator [Marinobacter sp.]QFS86496.1 Cell division inhibitor SulA [Marinobacter sp. THAF197a]QFT50279.1 Cell division inhibitor SulA [Marinobacter sp. THAF39]
MEQLSFTQNMAFQPAAIMPARTVSTGKARATALHSSSDVGRGTRDFGGNVTEIILPEGQVENVQLLLPMLTQLNQEKRWLALIDPPQSLVGKWQKMHGIVASELLVLRSTNDYSAQQLAERALSAGTCHAVVLWTNKLGRSAFESLQKASAQGSSHGVVLRHR